MRDLNYFVSVDCSQSRDEDVVIIIENKDFIFILLLRSSLLLDYQEFEKRILDFYWLPFTELSAKIKEKDQKSKICKRGKIRPQNDKK